MEFTRCYGCMEELPAPGAECPHCGFDNARDPARQPEHVLPCGAILNGQYVIGRSLGQGGFGITYIGYDLNLEMPVCIKEYYPEGSAMRSATQSRQVYWGSSENARSLRDSRKSFVKEAQKAVKLRDLPHVVSVWGVFYENETAYIVMDYVKGESLKSRLIRTQQPYGERECAELLAPMMQDLQKAHSRGIVHRDIKPDNIMLTQTGEAVLLDMGAAKDLGKSSQNGTPSSMMVVSHGFSPLEQYSERGVIGPWTDVYAMCATMYYCVSGKVLPPAIDRSVFDAAVNYRAFSPEAAAVLERGLALKNADRIQSMDQLLGELYQAFCGVPRPAQSREYFVLPEPREAGAEGQRLPPPEKKEMERREQELRLLLEQVRSEKESLRAERQAWEELRLRQPPQPAREADGQRRQQEQEEAERLRRLEQTRREGDRIRQEREEAERLRRLEQTRREGEQPAAGAECLSYQVHSDHVTILSCDAGAVQVAIPAQIEGKPVTSIGAYAFSGCHALRSVSIPQSVTGIGSKAFHDCSALERVDIPAGAAKIGNSTFGQCISLQSVRLPQGVTDIGGKAFFECAALRTVWIPWSVRNIDYNAFGGCPLREIYYAGTAEQWKEISVKRSAIPPETVIHCVDG